MFSGRRKFHVPLKYKILSGMLFVVFSGLTAFFYFAQRTFSEDKKLFVMELNLATLKAAIAEIKLELRGRIEEIQIFAPRVYKNGNQENQELYGGLSGRLEEELLGVTFLRKNIDGKFHVLKQYKNQPLHKKKGLSEGFYQELDRQRPLSFSHEMSEGVSLVNRSIRTWQKGFETDFPVLTVILTGRIISGGGKDTFVAVDLVQDFLRKKMHEGDLTEIFLISKSGYLISHADAKRLVDFAMVPFSHPLAPKLKERQFPRESLEVLDRGERYLCNLSETSFANTFAVSQVKKSDAFLPLKLLLQNTAYIGLLTLSIATFLSVFFASRFTRNIRKLKEAALCVGRGNWDVNLDIHSNDEIQSVSDSFQWMAARLNSLLKETAQKARMEEELETARLVQTTLLANPETKSPYFEVAPFFLPATECAGDLWDVYHTGSKTTLLIGDATGHGAGAAIVTAVAKSSFSTINMLNRKEVLSPQQFLSVLNENVFSLCKGKLLLTMCVVQVDLSTGEVLVGNAGHQPPVLLRNANGERKCEVLFARGERLGFQPSEKFKQEKYRMAIGETILLYTDGISEARNFEGKELGERRLFKLFSETGENNVFAIRENIANGTRSHLGDKPPADDLTFMVFSWIKRSTKQKKVSEAA